MIHNVLVVLLSIVCLFSTPRNYAMDDFDFGSMQNLQEELEEANRAIEEYLSSLSPEEQEEFNRQVEEVSRMFENMTEDDFNAFLGEMFSEESMQAPAASPSFAPAGSTQAATSSLSPEQKKKVDAIITVINDIIRQSNTFMVQISSSLEAVRLIDKWGKNGEITHWAQGSDWQSIKFDIEKLVQQLYTLEDKDLTTQEYRYILDLIEDQALVDILTTLQTNLNASVPLIEIAEFDMQSMSAQAKNAIKSTLEHYAQALYSANIAKSLDAIIEKYAPKAQKIRESEEALTKKSTDAAKRTRNPIGSSSAGVAESSGSSRSDYGYSGGYSGGYGDYGYSGGYSGGYGDYGYSGGYGDYDSYDSDSSKGFGGGSRGGATGGAGSLTGEAGQAAPKTPAAAVPHTKRAPIKKLSKNIEKTLEESAKIIKDNELFADIANHIQSTDESINPVNADLANDITKLNKTIKPLADEIGSLQRMILKENASTQAYYSESFLTEAQEAIQQITTLKTNLARLDFKKIKNKQSRISPEKEWAYFAASDSVLSKVKKTEAEGVEKIANLKQSVKTRVSLEELSNNVAELVSAITTFKDKTEKVRLEEQQKETLQSPVAEQTPAPQDIITFPELGQNPTE